MATKVKLRQKPMAGGKESLYLDFYPPIVNPQTGKSTRREFLKLYVYSKPRTTLERMHNTDTMLMAEQLRFKRENMILKEYLYTDIEREQMKFLEKSKKNFLEYYEETFRSRGLANVYRHNGALLLLKAYAGNCVRFADMDLEFCEGFRKYLMSAKSLYQKDKILAQNTKHHYMRSFKTMLLQAFKEGYIKEDFAHQIDSIPREDSKRQFLNIDELNKLAATPCAIDVVKRASLFSALTGLRFSDVQALTWGKLEYVKNLGYYINFRQQKTGAVERMPVSKQAVELMGEPRGFDDVVFENLNRFPHMRKMFRKWISDAGIEKHISFHCFRHSFATNQLTLGTAITTVSKLLGHRDLKTTMVYAKVVDSAKREAVDKLKLDIAPINIKKGGNI